MYVIDQLYQIKLLYVLFFQSESFQWDIEHVALLNPVDFGDVTDKLKRQDRFVFVFSFIPINLSFPMLTMIFRNF